MITEEIISKLNLKPTAKTIGASFANGITVYLWPNAVKGFKTYLADCNDEGALDKHGLIHFYCVCTDSSHTYLGTMTPDILNDCNADSIVNILKQVTSRQ